MFLYFPVQDGIYCVNVSVYTINGCFWYVLCSYLLEKYTVTYARITFYE